MEQLDGFVDYIVGVDRLFVGKAIASDSVWVPLGCKNTTCPSLWHKLSRCVSWGSAIRPILGNAIRCETYSY